jgi:hypothetical protein
MPLLQQSLHAMTTTKINLGWPYEHWVKTLIRICGVYIVVLSPKHGTMCYQLFRRANLAVRATGFPTLFHAASHAIPQREIGIGNRILGRPLKMTLNLQGGGTAFDLT